jgi:outer membrane protein
VLQAEETLNYAEAQKKSLESQLKVSQQRYEVGLDPMTSLYQAESAYNLANSTYIGSQNAFFTAKENLRILTNTSYDSFHRLQYNFETVAPEPTDIDTWTKAGIEKNLNLKAARFGMMAAQDTIKAQQGNRLPTLALTAGYNVGETQFVFAGGATTTNTATASLGVQGQFDAYTGGAASSTVRQAKAAYLTATAQMEQTYRQVIANTRTYYWNVLTGISQIEADRAAIKSGLSALKSAEAGYKVGTQIFTTVLQQQQALYQAQTTYTTDRINYLLATLQLKQSVGTLSVDDLLAIDAWLSETNESTLTQLVDKLSNTKIPVSGKTK